MTSVGLLYPGHAPRTIFRHSRPVSDPAGGVRLPLVHTSVGEDAHRVDALLDLGGHERLEDGAACWPAKARRGDVGVHLGQLRVRPGGRPPPGRRPSPTRPAARRRRRPRVRRGVPGIGLTRVRSRRRTPTTWQSTSRFLLRAASR